MKARLAALVSFVAILGLPLLAHPTANSFVVIGVSPSEIEVALTTDERALVIKLDALSGTPEGPHSGAPADSRWSALIPALLDHLELRLDGRSLPLAFRRIERSSDRAGQVRITIAAARPPDATSLRWRSSLFFGSYPLAVQSGPASAPPEADRPYEWLNGSDPSREYSLVSLGAASMAWSGLARPVMMGFTHILPGGLDHVLFVLGLTLLSANARALLLQITAFTIAHSATLALAMAGFVTAPGRLVEPLIAVSIAYVAIENLRTTVVSRWRLLIVFVFGLLHGLGFAGALADTGLAGGSFAATLVGFNVGVELGQLAVVLATLALTYALPLRDADRSRWIMRPASAAIGTIGLFWAVQRTFF